MLEMSDHIIIGTMRGDFLKNLAKVSHNILKQALNFQMRVPSIKGTEKDKKAFDLDEVEGKIGMIDFTRPSDYRLKAIEARKSGISLSTTSDGSHMTTAASRMSTVGTATSTDSLKNVNTPYEGNLISSMPPTPSPIHSDDDDFDNWPSIHPSIRPSLLLLFVFSLSLDFDSPEINWLIFVLNVLLIEPTLLSHDDKWNQLYAKVEQEAEKERVLSQTVPLKKQPTIEILENNLDKFQHTIEW